MYQTGRKRLCRLLPALALLFTLGVFFPGSRADAALPVHLRTLLDATNTRVTLVFSETILNGKDSPAELKAAVTFAPDGVLFRSLGTNDTVAIDRNTLRITFAAPLTGNANKITLAAGAVISAADRTPNAQIFTDYILPNMIVNAGKLQFSPVNYAVYEHCGAVPVQVSRTEGADGLVAVEYTTRDGSAVAGIDYQATKGTLVFNAGETTKAIMVPIFDDTIYKGNRALTVSLQNPTGGATLGSAATAVIGIMENDPEITGLVLNHTSLEMTLDGAPVHLVAAYSPYTTAAPQVFWLSTAPAVAGVAADGLVTPQAEGDAVILARTTDGQYTVTCTVSVRPATAPGTGEDSETFAPKENVPRFKAWTVLFNRPLDPETVNPANIYIRELDAAGKDAGPFAATVTQGADNRTITVTPVRLYKSGTAYALYITPGVKSLDGRSIARTIKLPFTVVDDTGKPAVVEAGKFTFIRGSLVNGEYEYRVQGAAGAVSAAGAAVKLYRWTDSNENNTVDNGELAGVTDLGESGPDGSVATPGNGPALTLAPNQTAHFVFTATVAGTESRKTGLPDNIVKTVVVPGAEAGAQTAAGTLSVNPAPGETGAEYQTITLTYTPGEFLLNGMVTFQLPVTLPPGQTLAADTNDQITLPGQLPTLLTSDQITENGKKVTITGVTAAPGQNVVLTLNNIKLTAEHTYEGASADGYFAVIADADGAGRTRLPSPGTGTERPSWTVGAGTPPTGEILNPGTDPVAMLTITFNEPLHTATLAKTLPAQVLAGAVIKRDTATINVQGLNWNTTNPQAPQLILVLPLTTFKTGEVITVNFVAGAVKDMAGNALDGNTPLTLIVTSSSGEVDWVVPPTYSFGIISGKVDPNLVNGIQASYGDDATPISAGKINLNADGTFAIVVSDVPIFTEVTVKAYKDEAIVKSTRVLKTL